MQGLTVSLLDQACRIFLNLAYPEGEHTIPLVKRAYFDLASVQSLEAVLVPPLCQPLSDSRSGFRGYAFRLGSNTYPNLKLQVVRCQDVPCVFAVDTHDALFLTPEHPDASRWSELQLVNRRLKEQIERAWEAAGLWTFNGLLRHDLNQV